MKIVKLGRHNAISKDTNLEDCAVEYLLNENRILVMAIRFR